MLPFILPLRQPLLAPGASGRAGLTRHPRSRGRIPGLLSARGDTVSIQIADSRDAPVARNEGQPAMRWAFLIIAVAAVVMLFGMQPKYAAYFAFLVLFINFATVCLQYDDPIKRARRRVAMRLSQMHPKGADPEFYQRLQSATPTPTADERRVRYGPLTVLNLATGIAATGLLVWAVVMRLT